MSDLPVVAQVTTEEDGNTLDGAPQAFVPQLEALGAHAHRRELQRRSRGHAGDRTDGPGGARAALRAAERRTSPRDRRPQHLPVVAGIYGVVRAIRGQRRPLVGGCCGTTSTCGTSRRRCAECRDSSAGGCRREGLRAGPGRGLVTPVARSAKSMANALARREFVISVELIPPRGRRAAAIVRSAPAADPRRRFREHS